MTNVDVTAVELRRMFKECPACEADLNGHSYAPVAITVATPETEESLGKFCRALKAQDWASLIKFDDFDPLLEYP
jgi:hypothetical protein